jgi:hypothetical protein
MTASRRRRLQFSLKMLLVIVAVASPLLAWVGGQVQILRTREAWRARLEFPNAMKYENNIMNAPGPGPPWICAWWRGEMEVYHIDLHPQRFSKEDMRAVAAAFPEAEVNLDQAAFKRSAESEFEVDPVFRTTGPGFLDGGQRGVRRVLRKASQGVRLARPW